MEHFKSLLDRLNQTIKPRVEKQTIEQSLIAICLFCDGIYSPQNSSNDDKPATRDILNPHNKIYNNEKQRNFLFNFGYFNTELFHKKIYEFIKNGFFDLDFNEIAIDYNKQFQIGELQYNFHEAWSDDFHGSFEDNGDEVVHKIYKAFIDGISVMKIVDFQSVHSLLSDYQMQEKAQEVRDLYYETHKNDKEKFNISSFFDDQEVRNFCKDSLLKIKINNRPSIEIAIENFLNNKYSSDNEDYLKQFSIDEYHKFFKESKIDNLDKLRVSEDFKNAKSAIEKIRKESLINELRIKYTSK